LRTESWYLCECKNLMYPLQNVVLLGDHEKTQPRSRLLNALHHTGVLFAPGRRPVDGDDAVTSAQSRIGSRRICSHLLYKDRVHGLVDLGSLVSRQHLQRTRDPLSFSLDFRARFTCLIRWYPHNRIRADRRWNVAAWIRSHSRHAGAGEFEDHEAVNSPSERIWRTLDLLDQDPNSVLVAGETSALPIYN